jgi:hypothetical protein
MYVSSMHKIVPSLWFDKDCEEAVNLYVAIHTRDEQDHHRRSPESVRPSVTPSSCPATRWSRPGQPGASIPCDTGLGLAGTIRPGNILCVLAGTDTH